jgi:hypothetical protein
VPGGEQLRTAGHDRLAVRNRTVTVQRRVVVLSRGGRLAGFATHTLGNGNGHTLACLESPAELADWNRPAVDVVLLDFPRRSRGIVYRQLRQRYGGPVLALLDPGEDGGLPASRGPLAVLHRPFSGDELFAVLDVLLDPPPETAEPPPPPPEAAAPEPPPAPVPQDDTPPVAPAAAVAPGAGRWRTRRLVWRGLRRWQLVAGATTLVLLGLSLGGHSGCQPSCAGVTAGAAESHPGERQADPGLRLDPGSLTDPQPGSELVVPPTLPQPAAGSGATATMGVGSLVSQLAAAAVAPPGTTGQPLGVSPAAGATGGGSLTTGSAPPASSPPPSPSGGTSPPATTPPATKPPATSPPTTSPPVTSSPTTVPSTTAPPVTEPSTTAPPPTTAPPTPTTEIPPPTTA